MSLTWERISANVMRSPEGYRVLRYTFSDGRRHFEAWPPKKGRIEWPNCHAMLGIRKKAQAAMALCEKHARGEARCE